MCRAARYLWGGGQAPRLLFKASKDLLSSVTGKVNLFGLARQTQLQIRLQLPNFIPNQTFSLVSSGFYLRTALGSRQMYIQSAFYEDAYFTPVTILPGNLLSGRPLQTPQH